MSFDQRAAGLFSRFDAIEEIPGVIGGRNIVGLVDFDFGGFAPFPFFLELAGLFGEDFEAFGRRIDRAVGAAEFDFAPSQCRIAAGFVLSEHQQ